MRLDARESVRDCLLLRLLERQGVVQSAGNQVCQRAQQQHFLLGKICRLRRFHVQDPVQLLRVKHRQRNCRQRVRQQRLESGIRGDIRVVRRQLAVARHLPDQTGTKRNSLSQRAPPPPRFRLNHDFPGRILELPDSDVVVRQSRLELLRNLRQHLVRIQRSDGIPRNGVEQRKVPRLCSLFLEQSCIFDRNAGLARQHPDRKSTRLNSSHGYISYAVFCLKKKNTKKNTTIIPRKKQKSNKNS